MGWFAWLKKFERSEYHKLNLLGDINGTSQHFFNRVFGAVKPIQMDKTKPSPQNRHEKSELLGVEKNMDESKLLPSEKPMEKNKPTHLDVSENRETPQNGWWK